MSISTMKTIILQLTHLHSRLNQLAEEKTEAIKKGDIQSVDRLAHQELSLIEGIQKLERERIEEVRRSTAGIARSESSWTFKSWIQEIVPEQEQKDWLEIYEKLYNAVQALKQANQLNQAMLKQALQRVRLGISLLQPRHIQTSSYGRAGNSKFTASIRRIDSRA